MIGTAKGVLFSYMYISVPFHAEVSVSEFENATSGSADLCVLNNTVPEEGKVRLYGDDPGKHYMYVLYISTQQCTEL